MTDMDKESEEGAKEIPQEASPPAAKQAGLFGSSGVQLTDEELSSPVTIKFLRHLNGVQEADLQKLKSYESQFFDKRQECEVLKKDLSSKKDIENIQKVMISIGSIMLGSLKFISESSWYVPFVMALLAVLLIVGGLFPVLRIGASK